MRLYKMRLYNWILVIILLGFSILFITPKEKPAYTNEIVAAAIPLSQTYSLNAETMYTHSYQCTPLSQNSYYCPEKSNFLEGEVAVATLQIPAKNGNCDFEYYAKGDSRIWDWDKLTINSKLKKCESVGNKGCSIKYKGNYAYCMISWHFVPNCIDTSAQIKIYENEETEYSVPFNMELKCGDGICSSACQEKCPLDCDFEPLKELNIKTHNQITAKTCGSAALQAILKFYNKNTPSQENIADEVMGWDGTEVNKMLYFLSKNDISAKATDHLTISKIKDEIDNQHPVIAVVYVLNQYQYQLLSKKIANFPRETHYIIIYGYDNNHLYVSDSLNGDRIYTYDAFEKIQYANLGITVQ